MNTTPTPKPPRLRRPKAGEALPTYGLGGEPGSGDWLRTLRARDRATVQRALAVLGAELADGRDVYDSPGMVKAYLRLHLGGEPVEHFAVLYVDAQNRFMALERLFTGTLTQTSVYPREIVQAALRHRAAGVILAHNHPSGSVQPSRADEALTATLKTTLALVDVRVVDHIIVGPGAALSMAEKGLL